LIYDADAAADGVGGASVGLVDDGAHGLGPVLRSDPFQRLEHVADAEEALGAEEADLLVAGEVGGERAVLLALAPLVLARRACLADFRLMRAPAATAAAGGGGGARGAGGVVGGGRGAGRGGRPVVGAGGGTSSVDVEVEVEARWRRLWLWLGGGGGGHAGTRARGRRGRGRDPRCRRRRRRRDRT